ncbi:hypothetical protein AAGW05_12115 [Arthrobacter sp. LAPM80]|uniref:hypothetical protein n=1 Tax=Arthrobacter sp. LAPM80 TaxID=3141788 RepID=UPI00398AE959
MDAAALWVLLATFGHYLDIGPLLTVYGGGSILAMLPLTPGGLGIVGGVIVSALIGFDTPAGQPPVARFVASLVTSGSFLAN